MHEPSPPRRGPASFPRARDNVFFPLLIACGGMFCLTTLILVMCTFDESGAPIVGFFERHAARMIYIQMGITICVALLALVIDRTRTLRLMNRPEGVAAASVEQPVPHRGEEHG